MLTYTYIYLNYIINNALNIVFNINTYVIVYIKNIIRNNFEIYYIMIDIVIFIINYNV